MKEQQRTSRFVELKDYNIDGNGNDFLEVTHPILTMTDYKQLCAELVAWAEKTSAHYYSEPGVLIRARTALAEPEPEDPTDEEIMELMPQQMHEDLAFAARAMAEHAGTDSTRAKGMMRIMLNRHVVDHARAVLARWGK